MPETLNAATVKRVLHVSHRTLHAMLADGSLKGFKRGQIVRITRQSVDELLAKPWQKRSA